MIYPLISVIIPFYSEIKWLYEALHSVQNQNYKNLEVLVINDGSGIDVSKLTKEFDLNIIIINKENGGPATARNLGITKSTGKYIAFLDSDDIWLSNKLSKQINEMEKNSYVWSQHSYEMFWENSKKKKLVSTEYYSGNVYRDCFISFKVQTSCVVVLRKVLIEENIRFPVNKRYGQDIEFYKYIAKNYPLGYISSTLSRFRMRGSNAGFRALVQLNNKASTWQQIEKDENVKELLPNPIIFAYRLSNRADNLLNKFSFMKNNNVKEILSKLFYVVPYSIFKIYSKKIKR